MSIEKNKDYYLIGEYRLREKENFINFENEFQNNYQILSADNVNNIQEIVLLDKKTGDICLVDEEGEIIYPNYKVPDFISSNKNINNIEASYHSLNAGYGLVKICYEEKVENVVTNNTIDFLVYNKSHIEYSTSLNDREIIPLSKNLICQKISRWDRTKNSGPVSRKSTIEFLQLKNDSKIEKIYSLDSNNYCSNIFANILDKEDIQTGNKDDKLIYLSFKNNALIPYQYYLFKYDEKNDKIQIEQVDHFSFRKELYSNSENKYLKKIATFEQDEYQNYLILSSNKEVPSSFVHTMKSNGIGSKKEKTVKKLPSSVLYKKDYIAYLNDPRTVGPNQDSDEYGIIIITNPSDKNKSLLKTIGEELKKEQYKYFQELFHEEPIEIEEELSPRDKYVIDSYESLILLNEENGKEIYLDIKKLEIDICQSKEFDNILYLDLDAKNKIYKIELNDKGAKLKQIFIDDKIINFSKFIRDESGEIWAITRDGRIISESSTNDNPRVIELPKNVRNPEFYQTVYGKILEVEQTIQKQISYIINDIKKPAIVTEETRIFYYNIDTGKYTVFNHDDVDDQDIPYLKLTKDNIIEYNYDYSDLGIVLVMSRTSNYETTYRPINMATGEIGTSSLNIIIKKQKNSDYKARALCDNELNDYDVLIPQNPIDEFMLKQYKKAKKENNKVKQRKRSNS